VSGGTQRASAQSAGAQTAEPNRTKPLAELRKLADRCQHGEMRTKLIRDRFICGLHNERIQKILLTKADLTLETARDIAVAHESAEQTTAEIQHHFQERKYEANQLAHKGAQCYRCDKPGHSPDQCWFRKKPYRKCGHTGYVAKVCRRGTKQYKVGEIPNQRSKLHKVLEDNSTSEDEMKPTTVIAKTKVNLDCMKMNEINAKNDKETIWVRLDVE